MALPSSGYLGQWFSTKQLFLKFSRIFRRPASGKRGRILIKVQVISLLSDITDRLARAFFGCVLSGNSSENEYVQKRITAHAVGTEHRKTPDNAQCGNLSDGMQNRFRLLAQRLLIKFLMKQASSRYLRLRCGKPR